MPIVLIVDDEAALRAAIAATFKTPGHTVGEAEGKAALTWLPKRTAAAVLLDLRMPENAC